MLKDEQRLAEVRRALLEFLLQQFHLRILASQAEHGGAGDIRVVDITGDQPAECSGIIACATATKSVIEKLQSVDIWENALRCGRRGICVELNELLDSRSLAVAVCKRVGQGTVGIRLGVSQCLAQGCAQHVQVPGLAEYQRHDNPVVGCSHPAVITLVTLKGAAMPWGGIGFIPRHVGFLSRILRGFVGDVPGMDEFTGGDSPGGTADSDTIHRDVISRLEVAPGKFLLGGYLFRRDEGVGDFRARGNVCQRDEYVVLGVNADGKGCGHACASISGNVDAVNQTGQRLSRHRDY